MVIEQSDLGRIDTPALVLDRGLVAANGRGMLERMRALGCRLRPHMKTLKSAGALDLVLDPEHRGIAVSTLNEAAYFAASGVSDIQLAVCLPPAKLDRAAAVLSAAPGFSFFIDSVEAATAARDHARRTGARHRVWVEIDSGEHRTGLAAEDDALLATAAALGPDMLIGVATHAGHAYANLDSDSMTALADHERMAVVHAAERLRGAGFPIEGVSAGSTPTAVHLRNAEGLTEVRAGVYMAGDLYQAAIGSVALENIAVSVLATVISHRRERGQIVIDAGGLALSKDRSTASGPGPDCGYGLVVDVEGKPAFGHLIVEDVHQEHGEIRRVSPIVFDALPIGARVRVLPNHVCMTSAMYDAYWVIDGGKSVVDVWSRTKGWT